MLVKRTNYMGDQDDGVSVSVSVSVGAVQCGAVRSVGKQNITRGFKHRSMTHTQISSASMILYLSYSSSRYKTLVNCESNLALRRTTVS